jgi:integrase/recombinase XerD
MTTTTPTPQLRPHIPTCLTSRTPKNGKQQALSQNQVQVSCAMRLLHAGVDTSVIALWLGHVSVDTTQIYLHPDLQLKEKPLARTQPPNTRVARYQPPDSLLAWLEVL